MGITKPAIAVACAAVVFFAWGCGKKDEGKPESPKSDEGRGR